MTPQARKKLNTAIFVILATIMNLVLMLLFLITGIVLLAKFGNPDNENANLVWMLVIFASSVGLASFIYSRVLKAFTKKVEVDRYFAPFLGNGKKSSKPVYEEDSSSSMKG